LAFVKVGQVRDVDVFHSAGKNTASEWGYQRGVIAMRKWERRTSMDSSDNGMELVVRPIEARDAADVFLLTEQLGYERPREAILEWIERIASDTMSQGAYVACLGDEVVG